MANLFLKEGPFSYLVTWDLQQAWAHLQQQHAGPRQALNEALQTKSLCVSSDSSFAFYLFSCFANTILYVHVGPEGAASSCTHPRRRGGEVTVYVYSELSAFPA